LDVLAGVARKRIPHRARRHAWVLSRPGVTSPILGARTEAQLDDNLAAIEVELTPEDIATLDMVTKPALNFPSAFLGGAVPASYPGITVNGRISNCIRAPRQMESR